jgi:hypothetical protein
MAALYLFSLVLGGGFLLLSLLGGESDGDVEFEGGLDLGDAGDMELDGLAGDMLEITGDALEITGEAMEATGDLGDHGQSAASRIFSIRTVVYALFGFGATGTILTQLGVGMLTSLAFALVGGFASGLLVSMVFHFLVRTDSGAHPGDASLLGLTGTVTLPIGDGSPGLVAVERGDRRLSLRALPHSSARGNPGDWTQVIVVEIERGIARVAPLEAEELDALGGGDE